MHTTSPATRVLEAIASHLHDHQNPPTLREVALSTDLAISTVHYHVVRLRDQGLVVRTVDRGARVNSLTALGWRQVARPPAVAKDTPLGFLRSRVRLPGVDEVQGWPSVDRVLLACATLRREAAPTLKEIAATAGVSVSAAFVSVQALRDRGLLAPRAPGVARATELTMAGAKVLLLAVLDAQLDEYAVASRVALDQTR